MLDSPQRERVTTGQHNDALPPAHAAVVVAAFAAGVVAQGAYYPPGRALVTVIVAVALVVALRARRPERADAWPLPVACGLLSCWILVRAAFAGGYPEAVGAVATLGCVAAVLVILRRTGPAGRERCAEALLAVGVLVAVTAWIGVAWRAPRFVIFVEHRLWRGASTLTYPNAAAALLAPLALLALALLVARPRSPVRAAVAYLLLVGVGAALSRAGFIALAAGFVVLALLAGVRQTAWHAAPAAIGAAIAVGALAPSFPAAGQPHPLLAVAGLLAGAAVAVGPVRLPGRLRAVALGAALVGVAFVATTQPARAVLAARANLDSSGRSGAVGAAFELIGEHPLAGTGVGQARFFWPTPDGNGAVALYAHDEYLQLLVDLGTVGLLLLLALFAAAAATIHRGRRCLHRPGVRAGAIAALAALTVHSGFDFLWHIAVLPLAGALLVGLAGPVHGEEPISPH